MTDAYEKIDRRGNLLLIFVLISLATIIDGIDTTIVYNVLPDMAASFGIGVSGSSWIVVSYAVGVLGLLLVFGKIADNGRIRLIFISGVVIFTAASLFCALSWNLESLVIMRFIQGIGASMMTATTPIMVVRLMPESIRGRGMGIMAAMSGVSVAIGPAIGGFIADMLSWEWIFIINVPIGIVLTILAVRFIPRPTNIGKGKVPDILSSIYLFSALCSGVILMESLIMSGITSSFVSVASGLVALVSLTLLVLRFRSGRIVNSVLDKRLFKNRGFLCVSLSFLLTTMIASGVMYLLPYYLQNGAGMDPAMSGLCISLASVLMIVTAVPTGRWCDVRGCRTPAAVSVVLRIAFSSIFVFMIPGWGMIPLAITLFTMGVSFGISGTSQSTRMTHQVIPEIQGEAATLTMVVNYLGSLLGIIAYTAAFVIATPGYAGISIADLPADMVVHGFNCTALAGVLLGIIALICTLIVKNHIPEKNDTSQ